jgi:tetratricopeptide (TPR) repeat protein
VLRKRYKIPVDLACRLRSFLSASEMMGSLMNQREISYGLRWLPRLICLVSSLAIVGLALADGPRALPPVPTGLFSPSNARTIDGNLIPESDFFPASRCASCHQDTHAAWSMSLHRNAAREPFYRESADILLRTRGIEFTRHCESCHTPVALFSGVLTKDSARTTAPFTKFDDEGVTCSVCHSIVEARVDGTGSFTIRRPALLAKEDGTPVFGDFSDEQILADVPGHKRAVMRPLLRTPEFCSTCHKVVAPPDLNGYKNIKGFSAYDEWQQSGASLESVLPFYRRDARADCRACHMPKIDSHNDRAAKNGLIASHRWPGANTAAPLFYGQTEQADLIKKFLESNVLAVDIFALRRESTGELIAPMSAGENRIALKPGEEIVAEVVASNRNAAHSFPPEVRDLYEAWVELEASDDSGKPIFHSGYIKPDGMLDETAHVYKTILLDESARVITRHQIWTTNIKAYDNNILPGRSDVARFRFRVPDNGSDRTVGIKLRARINYRRFNQEYTNYVLMMRNSTLDVPIVRMAEAEVVIGDLLSVTRGQQPAASLVPELRGHQETLSPGFRALSPDLLARRWNDYGIGLLEQAQYGPASEAFRRASEIDPSDPNLLANRAIAELRTERYGPEREQLRKAAALLDRALRLKPTFARARYWRAVVLRGYGKLAEAAETLSALAKENPKDREVQRQLGQTLYSLGRLDEARAALEAVVAIEPQDAGAYQLLAPIYASQGRKADADLARALYLQWRDDPLANPIAAKFYAAHPEWAEERVTSHTHGLDSARRATLTGALTNPVK